VENNTEEATGSQWKLVPRALMLLVRSALLSNWKFGTVIQVREDDPLSIVLEEEGMFLRRPSKLGLKRSRVRINHNENVLPIFVDHLRQQIKVLNLAPCTSRGQSELKADASLPSSHPHVCERLDSVDSPMVEEEKKESVAAGTEIGAKSSQRELVLDAFIMPRLSAGLKKEDLDSTRVFSFYCCKLGQLSSHLPLMYPLLLPLLLLLLPLLFLLLLPLLLLLPFRPLQRPRLCHLVCFAQSAMFQGLV